MILGSTVFPRVVLGQADTLQPARPAGPQFKTGAGGAQEWQQKLEQAARELKGLNEAQAKAGDGQEIERLQKQVELQQKQIELLLKMTQMLAEQVKKQAPAAGAVDELQERLATQEARTQRAALRDQELARAHDQLAETVDAANRNGPVLPSTLRELFLPTRTNESPLALYGTVAQAFQIFSGQPSTFRDRVVMLRPYMLLNERWLMSANIALQDGGVSLYRAQLERFINDNLTVVMGRFYSPIGFFSERLRENWVIKTPDPPLMFNQVLPLQWSFDGIQLRGAWKPGNGLVKLEYNGFVANGLSVQGTNLSPNLYSNLNNFTDSLDDVNNAKAYGGRVGVSIPKAGFIAGLSGLANGAYDTAHHGLNLYDVDVNWHRGNWDARFEYAHTDQQTPSFPIHRRGLYVQLAYRAYNCPNPILQRIEAVFRFDHVQFDGINIHQTGLNFGGLGQNYARMPLDRNRYTLGANYWFAPSLAAKVAYEVYDELGVPSLRDNGFLAQVVWGW
jgi:hypothetical protein